MWHTPTHNDLCKKQENDVDRQVPSKQDDDAVLDGDKKAISTQYITLSYIKLCILYYSSVYQLWSVYYDQSIVCDLYIKISLFVW